MLQDSARSARHNPYEPLRNRELKGGCIIGQIKEYIGTLCLSPKAPCRESPAVSRLAANPRRRETVGEALRCSRTPAHPDGDKNKICSTLCLVFIRKRFKVPVRCNELHTLSVCFRGNSKTNSHSFHLHPAVSSVHVFVANL